MTMAGPLVSHDSQTRGPMPRSGGEPSMHKAILQANWPSARSERAASEFDTSSRRDSSDADVPAAVTLASSTSGSDVGIASSHRGSRRTHSRSQSAVLTPPQQLRDPERGFDAPVRESRLASASKPHFLTAEAALKGAELLLAATARLGRAQRRREELHARLSAALAEEPAAARQREAALRVKVRAARQRLHEVQSRVSALAATVDSLGRSCRERQGLAATCRARAGELEDASRASRAAVARTASDVGLVGSERDALTGLVERVVALRSRAVVEAARAMVLGPMRVPLSLMHGSQVLEDIDRSWWSANALVIGRGLGRRPWVTREEEPKARTAKAHRGGALSGTRQGQPAASQMEAGPGVQAGDGVRGVEGRGASGEGTVGPPPRGPGDREEPAGTLLSIAGLDISGLLSPVSGLEAELEVGDEDVAQKLAAGLGYLALVLPVLGHYLDAPLQYTTQFGGSLSTVAPVCGLMSSSGGSLEGDHEAGLPWARRRVDGLPTMRGDAGHGASLPSTASVGRTSPETRSPEVVSHGLNASSWRKASSYGHLSDAAKSRSPMHASPRPSQLAAWRESADSLGLAADVVSPRGPRWRGDPMRGRGSATGEGQGTRQGATSARAPTGSRLSQGTMEAVRIRGVVDFSRPLLRQCLELLEHVNLLDPESSSLPLDADTVCNGRHLLPLALWRLTRDVKQILAVYQLDTPAEANVLESLYLLSLAAGA